MDHGQWVKRLESEGGMIVKLLADYPEGIAPAIRLSWSSMMNQRDFRKGLKRVPVLIISAPAS